MSSLSWSSVFEQSQNSVEESLKAQHQRCEATKIDALSKLQKHTSLVHMGQTAGALRIFLMEQSMGTGDMPGTTREDLKYLSTQFAALEKEAVSAMRTAYAVYKEARNRHIREGGAEDAVRDLCKRSFEANMSQDPHTAVHLFPSIPFLSPSTLMSHVSLPDPQQQENFAKYLELSDALDSANTHFMSAQSKRYKCGARLGEIDKDLKANSETLTAAAVNDAWKAWVGANREYEVGISEMDLQQTKLDELERTAGSAFSKFEPLREFLRVASQQATAELRSIYSEDAADEDAAPSSAALE
jgi:hypothetical protein